ncbi:hypothetical protein V6N13_048291 [Hibiscus sabdariffa]|uniref:Uncharacterized protein n=1 Tax=Hibiscus sabdariffa TaxID=183260 RepID=A0ABR2F6R8_9ROSI
MHDTPFLPPPLTADQFVGPGGRPPDVLPEVVIPQSSERPSLLIHEEDSQSFKRPKERTPTLADMQAAGSLNSVNGMREGADMDMDVSHANPCGFAGQKVIENTSEGLVKGKESYAIMAAKNSRVLGESNISCGFSDDDVVVLEDDYQQNNMGTTQATPLKPTDNELHGPWVTVDSQHCRNSSIRSNGGGPVKESRSKVVVGSRFASLLTEDAVDDREGISTGDISTTPTAPEPLRTGISSPVKTTSQLKTAKNVAYLQSNPTKKSNKASRHPEQSKTISVSVDADVIVVAQDIVGKSDNHIVVTLLEKKYENHEPSGGKVVKARNQASRGPLVGARKGFPVKKPSDVKSRPQLVLFDWMLNFSRQLDVPPSSSGQAEVGAT